MPLYEFECGACGRRHEQIQKFSDPPPAKCEACGKGPMTKLLSSPAIQFKGEGWYITDYARKGKTDGSAEKAEQAAKKKEGEGKSEKPAAAETGGQSAPSSQTESKPAVSTDSKSSPSTPASAPTTPAATKATAAKD